MQVCSLCVFIAITATANSELVILEAEQETSENVMSFKSFQINFSTISRWLSVLAVIWLLGSIGLGWLVNSFLILVGLLILAPVLAVVGFRWWLQRNLIQDQCPVCRYEFTGLNQTQLQCPNCGERLLVEKGHFNRLTPPGTIDVQAVEVPARPMED